MLCRVALNRAWKMPSVGKKAAVENLSEAIFHLVNGYGGSSGYPEVAGMAPGHCQARHCQAHGKTPLAVRGAC